MEFMTLAFFAAISLIFLLYFHLPWLKSSNRKNQPYKLPPEAHGSRLILGHLHLMTADGSPSDLPHLKLAAIADEYGPMFTIRLGVRRAVVVSSWELARELFTTCDAAISSRPELRASRHLTYNFAMFAFSPYSVYWRELRKLVSTELLSSRRVELMSHVCVSEIDESVKWLYEQRKDESGRVVVDMKKWFGHLNMNVILRMVAGKRISGGETERWRDVIREFFRLAGTFVLADALPYLWWLDLGGQEKRMKETAKELDGILGGWLEEHRQREYSGGDFMDVMLSAVGGVAHPFQGQYDADTVIKSTCEALVLGGTDTTAVTLIWALSLLLNNPHVMKKAQNELDEYVGRNRRVTKIDINNLPYIQAIIKETLRLYPSVPLGSPRIFDQDCNVNDYYIPKGTWLIMNIWKLQRDPQVWPDNPLDFIPERFLTTHRDVHVKGQDFELIPFGAGRRICTGVNLALQMLNMALASFLQAFDVTMVFDEKVDMTESVGLTNIKATPLDVFVTPRLPSYLY